MESNVVQDCVSNPWMRIREDAVITPTGSNGIYGLMESTDSVMIAVLNDKNELYLVRTFSYPAASWNWELPGGNRDIAKASRRELEEETGILAKSWQRLGKTRVCNGFMTEQMVTYLAKDIRLPARKKAPTNRLTRQSLYPWTKSMP